VTQIPSGWYLDPAPAQLGAPPGQRYWDGQQWTEHVYAGSLAPNRANMPATTPDGQRLAGWWVRVGASLLDQLILFPIVILAGLPFIIPIVHAYKLLFEQISREVDNGGVVTASQPDITGPAIGFAVVAILLNFVYNVGFLKWKQATPGKLITGLRVRLRDVPGPLLWRTVLLRWLGQNWAGLFAWVPLAGGVLGFYPLLDCLWPLWDDKKQALHDKVAKTNVVRHRG
jgi:uncharacterized RDD family membrane protein YckC